MIPGDKDEDVLKKLEFKLLVSHRKWTDSEDEGVSFPESRQWNEIVLRPAVPLENSCCTASTVLTNVDTYSESKKVRFTTTSLKSNNTYARRAGAQSVVLESTLASLSLGTAWVKSVSTGQNETRIIKDFCGHLRRSGKCPADRHCGQITDPAVKQSATYDVYHRDSPDIKQSWPFMSLKEVLSTDTLLRERLLYKERLRLAWLTALALLQLEGTRWISSSPTHNDIFTLRRERGSPVRDLFIVHHFPVPPTRKSDVNLMNLDRRSIMRSLGALLIEVMLGQPIHELVATNGDPTVLQPGDLLSDEGTARKLLDRVNMKAGDGYAGAVRRCIHEGFREDSFGDGGAQNAFAKIVGLLEDDLKSANL